MKLECHNLALDAIQDIKALEQLQERRRMANEYGFDSRIAHSTLDSAISFITKAGTKGDLISKQVESFNNHAEGVRRILPATEYVRPGFAIDLPAFDELSDVFAQLAIESIVNCECLKRE